MSELFAVGIADTHFAPKERLGQLRFNFKWERFDEVIAETIALAPKYFIIFGDLLQYPNPPEWLRDMIYMRVMKLIEADITVVYIDGNHDSSIISRLFAGDKRFKNPKFIIFNSTEVEYLEHFAIVNWFASLNRWYETVENVTALGHLEIIGARMDNGSPNEKGTPVSILKEKNIKVITGHFHTSQTHPNYEYIGSPFIHNFGERNNTGCFIKLFSDGSIERVNLRDWNFVNLKIENKVIRIVNPPLTTPTAIKAVIHSSEKVGLFKRNIKTLLERAGYENIVYLSTSVVLTDIVKVVEHNIPLKDNMLENLIEMGKNQNFSQAHFDCLNRWLNVNQTS